MIKQIALLAAAGLARDGKITERASILAEMERFVPWAQLCAVVEPAYPKQAIHQHAPTKARSA